MGLSASCRTGCCLMLKHSTKKIPALGACRQGANSKPVECARSAENRVSCQDQCVHGMQHRKQRDSPVLPPWPARLPEHQGLQGRRHAAYPTASGAGQHSARCQLLVAQRIHCPWGQRDYNLQDPPTQHTFVFLHWVPTARLQGFEPCLDIPAHPARR